MKDYDIANIVKDYRNQSVDACREMMIMWLQTVPSPTWGKLEDAISSLMKLLRAKCYGMLYVYSVSCQSLDIGSHYKYQMSKNSAYSSKHIGLCKNFHKAKTFSLEKNYSDTYKFANQYKIVL